MSFAELVSEMTDVCFSDAGVGESASYTGPEPGAEAKGARAVIDEPTDDPLFRDRPRSSLRERIVSVWIWRVDADGAALSVAKGGVLVITTSAGVVRTVTLVSMQASDPDRTQWSATEEDA